MKGREELEQLCKDRVQVLFSTKSCTHHPDHWRTTPSRHDLRRDVLSTCVELAYEDFVTTLQSGEPPRPLISKANRNGTGLLLGLIGVVVGYFLLGLAYPIMSGHDRDSVAHRTYESLRVSNIPGFVPDV